MDNFKIVAISVALTAVPQEIAKKLFRRINPPLVLILYNCPKKHLDTGFYRLQGALGHVRSCPNREKGNPYPRTACSHATCRGLRVSFSASYSRKS